MRSKLIEIARALQLEWHFSKREILGIWLTLAPYGGNLEGVRAGAMAWFGASARNLDAVMKEYAPGGELFVFDSDLPRQHSGWESYKEDWWVFLGATTAVKAQVEALGVTVVGDAAFSHNLLHLTWTSKADGSRREQLMSVSDAYRKIDGHWRIAGQSLERLGDSGAG